MNRVRVMNSRSVKAAGLSLLIVLSMSLQNHAEDQRPALTRERASAFARLALKGLNKEYPNKPEHVMSGPSDVMGPKALHPAFFGCYDWHSSVHGHWMLVRLLRLFPDLPEQNEIRGDSGDAFHGRESESRGRLFRPKGQQVVRTALRLGVAAQARGRASRLGRPRRQGLVEEFPAARGRDRRAISRFLPQADVPDPNRRASQHGLRSRVCP